MVVVFGLAFGLLAMIFGLGHVEFAPDDRLNALRFGGVVEMNGAEDVAVVGHGDRRLPEGRDARDQLLYIARPIEHGVVGMQVQVRELRHEAGVSPLSPTVFGLGPLENSSQQWITGMSAVARIA